MKFLTFPFSSPEIAHQFLNLRKILISKGRSLESEIEYFISEMFDKEDKSNEKTKIVSEKEALEMLKTHGISVTRQALRYHRVNGKMNDDYGSFYFISGRNQYTVFYEWPRLLKYFKSIKGQ